MKLLIVNSCYPGFLTQVYAEKINLSELDYKIQQQAIFDEVYDWSNHWNAALKPYGYEVREHMVNATEMQKAWGRENGIDLASKNWAHDVLVAQAKQFSPEVLWYDYFDADLLKRLKSELKSLKLVMGWVGSAIAPSNVWSEMDIILSCAPESVETLAAAGHKAAHLNHGFSPTVLEKIRPEPEKYELSFIGQIIRGSQFHNDREKLLLSLLNEVDLNIFSPSATIKPFSTVELLARKTLFAAAQLIRQGGTSETLIGKVPLLRKAAQWTASPVQPVSPEFQSRLFPAVFGRKMYEVIASSKMTLNIHADSSPRFVSNMRLFETTGVGSCELVDWRPNLPDLFVPDEEIVVYRNAAECVEKVRWLRDHPKERERIARAGQQKCLKEHTFEKRAGDLDKIIQKHL